MSKQSFSNLPLILAGGFATAAFFVMPQAAFAQSEGDAASGQLDSGVYATLRVGATLPSDISLSGTQDPQAPSPGTAGAPANVEAGLDSALTVSGAIGYQFDKRVFGLFQPSLELEYKYANPNVSGGNFNGGNQTFQGDVEVHSFFINYQSDIIWSDNQRVVPFIGSGIGITQFDSNIQYFPATQTAPTFGVVSNDTAFTYQSNAGIRFNLSDTISLDTRVRYQRVNGLDLERRFIAGNNDAFNANVSGDYETVDVVAGLRVRF